MLGDVIVLEDLISAERAARDHIRDLERRLRKANAKHVAIRRRREMLELNARLDECVVVELDLGSDECRPQQLTRFCGRSHARMGVFAHDQLSILTDYA